MGQVEPPGPDVIGTEPRPIFSHWGWVATVVVLTAALAAAIITATHHHAEAAARRPERPVAVAPSPEPGPLTLSAKTAILPSAGPLAGEITIFSVRLANGAVQVMLTGHISGGIPHRRYALVGNDCTVNTPDHAWAAGIADARGQASLSGRTWTVSPQDEYWFQLTPWPHRQIPGLHGGLAPDGSLTAFRAGWAPCTPS